MWVEHLVVLWEADGVDKVELPCKPSERKEPKAPACQHTNRNLFSPCVYVCVWVCVCVCVCCGKGKEKLHSHDVADAEVPHRLPHTVERVIDATKQQHRKG